MWERERKCRFDRQHKDTGRRWEDLCYGGRKQRDEQIGLFTGGFHRYFGITGDLFGGTVLMIVCYTIGDPCDYSMLQSSGLSHQAATEADALDEHQQPKNGLE